MCSLGLWITVQLFGQIDPTDAATIVATFLLAGLVFSVINSVIKPIVTMLSIPFVIVTIGLFTIIINGFMVWLTIRIVPGIHMGFGWAIVSSLVISLLNYVINSFIPDSD